MTLRELWHGCLLSHGETVWEHEHMVCLTCGTVIQVLPQATVRGPAHIPEPVRGVPITKVYPTAKVEDLMRRRA